MNNIKITISLLVLMAILSCSKFPFSKKDDDSKENDLKKREQEITEKELELKEQEQQKLEDQKNELQKKEDELNIKETQLEKQNRIKAAGSPLETPKKMIQYIDEYVGRGNDNALVLAYDLWRNPASSIGSYEKFKSGFSNTMSDKIISTQVINNDGDYSEVLITHIASEYNTKSTSNYDKYQKSKYDAKYKLENINGVWKIKSGKVSVISREYY